MSANWPAIDAALAVAIASGTGLDATKVDGKRKFVSPVAGAAAYYEIKNRNRTGEDSVSYDDTGDAAPALPLRQRVTGRRTFTCEIRVESFTHTADREAGAYLELLRSRLSLDYVRDGLRAEGLVLMNTGQTVPIPTVYDDRRRSVAVLELFFEHCVAEVAPDAFRTGVIESIEITTRFKDEAGENFPAPPNVTEMEFPT